MITGSFYNARKRVKANELQSKSMSDRFVGKEKPSAVTEGLGRQKTIDSVKESKVETLNNSTIQQSPNLYKQFGDSMSNNGHVQILHE